MFNRSILSLANVYSVIPLTSYFSMSQLALKKLQANILKCNLCEKMQSQPVVGNPVMSKILLIGQAPGIKERDIRKPFAWTAGKTLFKWFASIGVDEPAFRDAIYMTAICRCFPGKKIVNGIAKGGDRVPDKHEIKLCSKWLQKEVECLKPELIIPVGKLAISQLMPVDKLDKVIGQKFKLDFYRQTADIIPLPHPSGASTWHQRSPGKDLLNQALKKINNHSAWKSTFK